MRQTSAWVTSTIHQEGLLDKKAAALAFFIRVANVRVLATLDSVVISWSFLLQESLALRNYFLMGAITDALGLSGDDARQQPWMVVGVQSC